MNILFDLVTCQSKYGAGEYARRWPNMEYWIVGGRASEKNAQRWGAVQDVKVCGFVKDLSSVYSDTLASVIPVRMGSGSCIKPLESLAYTCTCLATEFGARGIDKDRLCDGEYGLWVWHDADEFVAELETVIAGGDAIANNERRGQGMIEELYSQRSFETTVMSLVRKGAGDKGWDCQRQ